MMNTTMRKIFKILVWLVGIALAIGLFFADNIRGHYRFKEICAKDGGLKLFQPLERDVGWLADGDIYSAIPMTAYDAVPFVRYLNAKDGQWYDVYRAKRLQVRDDDYAQQPADLSKPVVYQEKWSTKELLNETRMSITKTEFIDLRTKQVVATYTKYGYSPFDTQKMGVGASGVGCPEQGGGTDPKTGKAITPHEMLAIESIFKQ